MTRIAEITLRGHGEGHASAAALARRPGDVALDHRGLARAFVMRCPDGCGALLTLNLDPRAGQAWRADSRGRRLTLYPSIRREDGCRAHFILWRDRVIWCDRSDPPPWRDENLVRHVRTCLSRREHEFQHFEGVAAELDEIPWEVLWACEALHQAGLAEVRDGVYFRLPLRTADPADVGAAP